jgi:hypothetical protein
MADPLNPRLGPAALLEEILRDHPGLTREPFEKTSGVIEMGALIGYDFETKPKSKIKWGPNVVDETAERADETVTVIGARQQAPKRSP